MCYQTTSCVNVPLNDDVKLLYATIVVHTKKIFRLLLFLSILALPTHSMHHCDI